MMKETMNLTEKERDWRAEMVEKLSTLGAAIEAINGPYKQTRDALRAMKDVAGLAVDDEDFGPCTACGAHIWLIAGDESVSNEDGDVFCIRCVKRWNDDPENSAQAPSAGFGA